MFEQALLRPAEFDLDDDRSGLAHRGVGRREFDVAIHLVERIGGRIARRVEADRQVATADWLFEAAAVPSIGLAAEVPAEALFFFE